MPCRLETWAVALNLIEAHSHTPRSFKTDQSFLYESTSIAAVYGTDYSLTSVRIIGQPRTQYASTGY